MMLRRVNKIGVTYHLTDMGDGRTMLSTGTKSLVVDAHIDRISQGWYSWQMNGALIQDAFPYLSAGEREFILTGITQMEWNELFGETK
jgi:hypothetical protein